MLRGAATLARRLSTAPVIPPAAAAPAAAAAPPAPAPAAVAARLADYRERTGQTLTMPWTRYDPDASRSPAYTLENARAARVLAATTEFTADKKCTIYKRSKSAMTSGLAASRGWAIRWDKRPAWTNPLMGWVSSMDTHQALNMSAKFETADAAIAYAERNGWKYEVARPFSRTPGRVDSAYAYNFVPVATQAKLESFGARRARHMFESDTGKSSQWVNWRRTQFGAEPWKPASYQTKAAWTGPGWPAAKIATPSQGSSE